MKQLTRVYSLLLCLCVSMTAYAQELLKADFDNQPIKMLSVNVGDSAQLTDPRSSINVVSDQRITDKQNWVRTLRVELQNTYEKPISYIEMAVVVYPKDKKFAIPVLTLFTKGTSPYIDKEGKSSSFGNIVQPGDKFTFDFSEVGFVKQVTAISKNISRDAWLRTEVKIFKVVFNNELMWLGSGSFEHNPPKTGNGFFKPDPKKKNAWIRVDNM
jgi:hypothetical protein